MSQPISNHNRHTSIKRMESIWGGMYSKARGALGIDAFGLGVMTLPANFDRMPAHVHTFDGQEEVYVPIAGSGFIEIGDNRLPIDPDTAVRVGPTASRRLIAGEDGLQVVIAAGVPGEAYGTFAPLEIGEPDPDPRELPGVIAAKDHASDDDYTAVALDGNLAISGVVPGISFSPVGRALDLQSFGMALVELDPGEESHYPLHTHEEDGQTEVYVVTEGEGWIEIDGGSVAIAPGEMIAVEPESRRKLHPVPEEGLRVLIFGAPSGKPYDGNRPTQF